MTPEKKYERKLREAVEKLGGLCLKFPATHFAGIPDRICLLPGGRLFFAELKGPGKKQSPRQLYVARKLTALGFDCFVIDSAESLAITIEWLFDLHRFTHGTK